MYGKVVVGVDENDHSFEAISAALELTKLTRDEVVVVHVQTLGSPSPGAGPMPIEDSGQAQALVDKTVAMFTSAGLKASGHLQRSTVDKVADVLLEVAKVEKAGLIVVGTRGHGDIHAALFGSTAHKDLHGASIPVLVHRDTRTD